MRIATTSTLHRRRMEGERATGESPAVVASGQQEQSVRRSIQFMLNRGPFLLL